MRLIVNYNKQSDKFLRKNSQIITKDKVLELLKKAVGIVVLNQEVNLDLKGLKGQYKDCYRIRYRDIRIIFMIIEEKDLVILYIQAIDYRGNIYS